MREKFKIKSKKGKVDEVINESFDSENSIKNHLLVYTFIFILFSISTIIFLKPQRDVSINENRKLGQFYFPKIKHLLNGKYQNDLQKAMEDQMILSQTFKNIVNRVNNLNRNVLNNLIYDKSAIIPASRGYCKLGNSGYIIYCPKDFNYFEKGLTTNINTINNLNRNYNNIKFYAYRVITDDDINEDGFILNIEEYIKDNIDFKYASFSKIKSYNDYKEYYYKSDHHWNYKGSYEGYKEIINLLNEKVLYVPKDITCFKDTSFVGSEASAIGDLSISDEFCVYDFDYVNLSEKVYGTYKSYGNIDEYYKGSYKKGKSNSHYSDYYGGNYGEVVFNNNEKNNKKNLLLLVDSMSNPVNRLIASNYNNTYVVDLRRYSTFKGETFIFDNYVKEHKINEVLFLGNIRFYSGEEFIPKLNSK